MLLLILLLIGAVVFTVIAFKFKDDDTFGEFLMKLINMMGSLASIIGFVIVRSCALYCCSI